MPFRRRGHLEGVVETDRHADPFVPPEADVESADEGGAHHSPEAQAGAVMEVPPRAPAEQIAGGVEHLSEVEEGSDLDLPADVEQGGAEHPDPFLDVEEQHSLVDETAAVVAPQGRGTPERRKFPEGD